VPERRQQVDDHFLTDGTERVLGPEVVVEVAVTEEKRCGHEREMRIR